MSPIKKKMGCDVNFEKEKREGLSSIPVQNRPDSGITP
jgi:hypothetical protein